MAEKKNWRGETMFKQHLAPFCWINLKARGVVTELSKSKQALYYLWNIDFLIIWFNKNICPWTYKVLPFAIDLQWTEEAWDS